MGSVSITASYAFTALDAAHLHKLRAEMVAFGANKNMRGLVLLAPEGINATVSGSAEAIGEWKAHLRVLFGEIVFKDSSAETEVFSRWSVKIKREIVCIKDESLQPGGKHNHLTPEQWQEMLGREDVVVVDTRNTYEYAIGKFRGAMHPGIRAFQDFPQSLRQAGIPKDKKVLMYCTGGIRCEKALLAMEAQGYDNVYQLEGGILAYLERFPEGAFEGECFVFDKRVAVDQHLRPSRTYELCPHCGDPGEVSIHCTCGTQKKICDRCFGDASRHTCSKRCRNVNVLAALATK